MVRNYARKTRPKQLPEVLPVPFGAGEKRREAGMKSGASLALFNRLSYH